MLAKALVTGLVAYARDLDGASRRSRRAAGEARRPSDAWALRGSCCRSATCTRSRAARAPSPATSGLARPAQLGERCQVGVEAESLREALHDAATDRQNVIVKQLTVVAGIFLPLTFITGFFGQNFSWMVDHVGGRRRRSSSSGSSSRSRSRPAPVAFRRAGWL